MRAFWVPPGVIFWCFSMALFFHRFLVIFRWKNYKHEKSRSVSRYVNYDVSWGSPGWKKREKLWKITLKKTSIFHENSTPNRVRKLSQTKHAIKITRKIRPAALWRSTGRFWVDLGDPRGPQNRRFGASTSDKDCSWNQPGSILGAKLNIF